MLDYILTEISALSVHSIGNKTLDENLELTKEPLDISDDRLRHLLLRYFLSHFNTPEFYGFTFSNDDFKMNPVFQYIHQVFEHDSSLHLQSVQLAQHLFECALHPNIKAGDFYVARFSAMVVEGEELEAIGLFKSETKDEFLKLQSDSGKYKMGYEDGINIDKLDKGCLIFNTNSDTGYKVLVLDKSSKGGDAQYWKNTFLNLKPLADNYHHTANFLGLTKNFVTKQLSEDFEVTKAEQVDFLNRSMDYFKKKDKFDEQEFASEVFNDTAVIESFRKYKNEFEGERGIEIEDEFSISSPAVKKQSRIFKSVLKLDKNFHIYIHGDKELIERGTDPNGRKYYKIYYEEEN